MPYVPPEVKERIKREIPVQRLVEARSGRSRMGLCPFHKDTNPRLSVDAQLHDASHVRSLGPDEVEEYAVVVVL